MNTYTPLARVVFALVWS